MQSEKLVKSLCVYLCTCIQAQPFSNRLAVDFGLFLLLGLVVSVIVHFFLYLWGLIYKISYDIS